MGSGMDNTAGSLCRSACFMQDLWFSVLMVYGGVSVHQDDMNAWCVLRALPDRTVPPGRR